MQSAWHTVLFVFQQLYKAGNSKYPYFTEKETEAQRTVQDPRSSEYQGLDSNQGLPACSQSLALSTIWCYRPCARAYLEMRDCQLRWARNCMEFIFCVARYCHGLEMLWKILTWMPQISKGFSSPLMKKQKSSMATGSIYPQWREEREELAAATPLFWPSLFLTTSRIVAGVTDLQVPDSFVSYRKIQCWGLSGHCWIIEL